MYTHAVKLYRASNAAFVEQSGKWYQLEEDWGELTSRDDLASWLETRIAGTKTIAPPGDGAFLAPIAKQEVWAAGVTYFRSRTARMEESEKAGGGSFYDRVYEAERPELFFKSTPHRVVGPGAAVHIRSDSKWNAPEPELALLLSPSGKLIGYTIGNDMSSRDIEGENPLYLPQAKLYDRSCALGPGILVSPDTLSGNTRISLEIIRDGARCFFDEITLSQMKRTPETLISYLFRENSFPDGCFLLTGTGIVPPDTFTLESGDQVVIGIEGIGTLLNPVD